MPSVVELKEPRFGYVDIERAEQMVTVEAGDVMLEVVGHQAAGAYECILWEHDVNGDPIMQAHSNCGWGCCSICLYEGLQRLHAMYGN